MVSWNIHRIIQKRYILSLLSFVSFIIINCMMSNLSIAIVAMTNSSTDQLSDNSSSLSIDTFNWSSKTQGYVLSSMFYGLLGSQFPAGFLATKIGGKYVFGIGICSAGVLSLFIPLCALAGPTSLIVLQVFQGIALGCTVSPMHTIWSKWAPKGDKSTLVSFAYSGNPLGTALSMLLGGVIATYWSWEWIFYLTGIFAVICAFLWLYFITESPSTHSTITSEELEYIESNLDHAIMRNYSFPWKSILTSVPLWAIIIAHFSVNWMVFFILTELPTFLAHALDHPIEQTGAIAFAPWIVFAILTFLAGFLTDKLTKRYSTVYVRKSIIAISFIISLLALIIVVLLKSNQHVLITTFLIISFVVCAFSFSTVLVNFFDIGGQYAGFLMGLSNTFGSLPGIILPTLVAELVPHTNLESEWNLIFIISIVLLGCTTIFYVIFGSASLQSWVDYDSNEHQAVLSKSVPSEGNSIDNLTNIVRAEMDN